MLIAAGATCPARASWAAVIWCDAQRLFYLFGVWSIGSAMGQLAKGRLIQPTLAAALRRVGLALGLAVCSASSCVTNLFASDRRKRAAAICNFDVAGMTLGMIGGALFLLGRVVDQAGRSRPSWTR